MQQEKELIFLFIFIGIFLIIFVISVVLFIGQYRKAKIANIKETTMLQHLHQQQLLRAQLEMQTQTMQEIGREIHDNVGQKLTLASLYTQQLDYDNKYPEITERIGSISNIINESLNELRSLSKNLTNEHIQQHSLKALIETEIEKVKLTNKYTLDISIDHANGYSVLTKTIVVRLVQEFFQNSMKHANATILSLQLHRNMDGLHLLLKDNGIGFDTTNSESPKGIGLQNMKKRIALVSGTISIDSAINEGTAMTIFIPNEKL